MEAGRLRHSIAFLQRPAQPQQNQYGEPISTWLPVLTARASMEPLLGNEYFRAEQAQSEVEVKFRCRYRAGVTDEMRLTVNGETYNILSLVNVNGLGREMLIYASKVRDDG